MIDWTLAAELGRKKRALPGFEWVEGMGFVAAREALLVEERGSFTTVNTERTERRVARRTT